MCVYVWEREKKEGEWWRLKRNWGRQIVPCSAVTVDINQALCWRTGAGPRERINFQGAGFAASSPGNSRVHGKFLSVKDSSKRILCPLVFCNIDDWGCSPLIFFYFLFFLAVWIINVEVPVWTKVIGRLSDPHQGHESSVQLLFKCFTLPARIKGPLFCKIHLNTVF